MWPLPTPLVVMITKLSLIGIPSKNSISLSLVAAAHLSTQGANKDALHSKRYQTVHAKHRGRWQFACPLSHDLNIAVSVLRTTFNANI